MATKRVKRDCGGKVHDEPNTMYEDRISQLPDSLIHHIFSFLPTIYIVRMCILSKRWRHLWISTPFLCFHEVKDITFLRKVNTHKKVNQRHLFFKFVNKCLRRREPYMQSFKLHARYKFGHRAIEEVDGWLRFALQSKVKDLDLQVTQYCLPRFLLKANSLTQLKLTDLRLELPVLSSFPNLRVLFLDSVESDHESLENLISGCPVIEDLQLVRGFILEDIDFAVSGTLRNLSLSHMNFTDQWLEGLISGLPLLERFTLHCKVGQFKNNSITSHSLKYLSVRAITNIEVSLRTPSLVFLSFASFYKSNISLEAPNLLEANLGLWHYELNEASYLDVVRFLSNFSCLKKLMLSILWGKVLQII